MQDYRDFTPDPERFGDLGEFVGELHDKHMRYIPILDSGIA
jgi:alpha-glucosidase (family GH31 glycosyl hydrolase)